SEISITQELPCPIRLNYDIQVFNINSNLTVSEYFIHSDLKGLCSALDVKISSIQMKEPLNMSRPRSFYPNTPLARFRPQYRTNLQQQPYAVPKFDPRSLRPAERYV
ncbi:hypothetical protein TNIN_486231, partial [Trichonephila inaurata madagascariensis]